MNPSAGGSAEAYVNPFPSPGFLGADGVFTLASLALFLPVLFALAFFLWLGFTFVVAYHWFRYGHRTLQAIPLLAVHMVVSGTLLLLATAGLR